MLVWVIVSVIPLVLLGSAVLAPKGGPHRRGGAGKAWLETEVGHKAPSWSSPIEPAAQSRAKPTGLRVLAGPGS